MESWLKEGKLWGKAFLSWNREREDVYGDYVQELHAQLKKKGLDLIYQHDFDPDLILHDDTSLLFGKFVFVLISKDYVLSSSCIHELVLLYSSGFGLRPIFFYSDDEYNASRDTIDWFDRFQSFYESANTHGHDPTIVWDALLPFFSGVPHPYDRPSVDVVVDRLIHVIVANDSLPDYNTFCSLDSCAKTLPRLLLATTSCDDEQQQLMYVGIWGKTTKSNKLITDALLRSSPLLSSFQSVKTLASYHTMDTSIDRDLSKWGMMLSQYLLRLSDKGGYYPHLQTALNRLPNDRYLIIIENVDHFCQIKALAGLLDFINPSSRIVFATTNEDFFSYSKGPSWTSYGQLDSSKNSLFFFNGTVSINTNTTGDSSDSCDSHSTLVDQSDEDVTSDQWERSSHETAHKKLKC